MGCLAMGFGVMFFAAAGVTVWSAVGALIHSEWREAAEQLGLAALMLLGARVLWLAGRGHNVDILTGENLDVPAAESDAMLQTLDRYDRLLTQAPTGESARASGTPDSTRDERVQEPTDRGYETRIAARMKERKDPG